MTTAVRIARQWVGYLEHKDRALLFVYRANTGKGGCTAFAQIVAEQYRWRNFQRMPWCAVFVHAVYIMAFGKKRAAALLGKPHPGTRVLRRRMRRYGRWRGRDYVPAPGDIIFCSNARDGCVSHCGIVEAVSGGKVYSIEGNTVDPSGVFPENQGGAVARRERDKDDPCIVGYASIKE